MAENTQIYINTNITTGEHFDRSGASFGGYSPQVSYKSSFRVYWQLYTATPNANADGVNIADWPKASSFAGCGALLTCDNDYIHRISGTITDAIASGGSISSVTVTVPAASAGNIPQSGYVSLFLASGEQIELTYASRETSGNTVTLALNEAYSPDADIPSGTIAKISQEVMFQAVYDVAASNPGSGLFVFDAVAYSAKMAAIGDASTSRFIPILGLELLPFYITTENEFIELPSYILDTFAVSVNLGEAGRNPQITDHAENLLAGIVGAMISAGMELELYNSVTGEWEAYSAEVQYTTAYTKYRFRLASTGDAGQWAEVPMLNGIDGADAPAMRIQYSADGVNYHATLAAGDKYIRFSTDEGVTWSAGVQFVGSNAPNVQIQYSATAGAGTWHSEKAADDIYIRFSVDGGTSWTGAMQAVAFPVKFQYGSTATDTFHADYISGVDKYMKMSVDGGNTWGSAILFCGEDGQSFVPDATGALADRSAYDGEKKGFAYLVTSGDDAGKIYFKTTDDSGSWSDGLQFTPFGVAIQYSADNASWHTSQQEGDVYIRYSVDGGDTWSAGSRFAGVSAYTYYAYAADTAGNGFALAPASGLKFRNEIHTSAAYATADLTAALFASEGIGWYQYTGEDGVSYEWLSGTDVPSASLGEDGEWYLKTDTADVYTKIAGNWVLKLNLKGPAGAGVTVRGGWTIDASYATNDMVTYSGSAYIATQPSTGVIPTDTAYWTLYIEKGAQGAPGEPLEANYVDVTEVTNGYMVIDDATIPVSVEIGGTVYDIDSGMVIHEGETFKIPVAPFLAMANLASFSGTWRVWRAGGKTGDTGGTFVIEVVSNLPTNPVANTLYLIPEV